MTNTKLANKLSNMKEQIDDAKIEKNKEEGKLDERLKHLKREFQCKNLKATEKTINETKKEIEKEQGILEKGVSRLENNYEL